MRTLGARQQVALAKRPGVTNSPERQAIVRANIGASQTKVWDSPRSLRNCSSKGRPAKLAGRASVSTQTTVAAKPAEISSRATDAVGCAQTGKMPRRSASASWRSR